MTRISIDHIDNFVAQTKRILSRSSFRYPFHSDTIFSKLQVDAKCSTTRSRELLFFFSHCSAIFAKRLSTVRSMYACVYADVRALYVDIVRAYARPKAVLRAMKIVRVYCTNASLSDVRTRMRSFARVYMNLRPASCSHENVPSSSSSDSQATVDDASSRTSRLESSLSLALPSLRRLVPLCLLLLLSLLLHLLLIALFPSFSFSFSFALSL